ncbi:hypothetical protein [Herpetosiphon giganteus]|uniref:hypothetical protein n=1 Tax=Herpetosiphon giganteus TaxID=2029754 RepID=UPI001958B396|nr:hypothetical protein [Herpetosiphon giganteus]MBM7841747.1 hypothetical protein [Herpetosiphon giganteus]
MKRVWLSLILLFLVSCGGATPTSVPATATTAATPTTAASPEVLLTFAQTGGIAGINETLTVWSDGKLELASVSAASTLRIGEATPAQLSSIQTLLNDPEFASLAASYGDLGSCCDMFSYTLTTGNKSIATIDGAEYPEILANLFGELQTLKQSIPQ